MSRTAGRIKYFSLRNGSVGKFSLNVLRIMFPVVNIIRKIFSDLMIFVMQLILDFIKVGCKGWSKVDFNMERF